MKTKKLICTLTAMLMVNGTTMNVLGATGDTPVTYTYNGTSASQPFEYDDELFGKAISVVKGYNGKIKAINENNYSNSYCQLDKYVYEVYGYEKLVNCCVTELGDGLIRISPGVTKTITFEIEEEQTVSYSSSIMSQIETALSIGGSATAGTNQYNKISIEANTEVSTAIESAYSTTETYTIKKGYSETVTFNAKDKEMLYSWEVRACYNVYVTNLYQINYEKSKKAHRTWYGKKYYTYSYSVDNLELVDTMYSYKIVSGTLESGFYQYKNTPTGVAYDNERYEFYTYLD